MNQQGFSLWYWTQFMFIQMSVNDKAFLKKLSIIQKKNSRKRRQFELFWINSILSYSITAGLIHGNYRQLHSLESFRKHSNFLLSRRFSPTGKPNEKSQRAKSKLDSGSSSFGIIMHCRNLSCLALVVSFAAKQNKEQKNHDVPGWRAKTSFCFLLRKQNWKQLEINKASGKSVWEWEQRKHAEHGMKRNTRDKIFMEIHSSQLISDHIISIRRNFLPYSPFFS